MNNVAEKYVHHLSLDTHTKINIGNSLHNNMITVLIILFKKNLFTELYP
jgi:hypothetical protein